MTGLMLLCSLFQGIEYRERRLFFSILLLYKELGCVGRIRTSRILDIPERTSRRVIDELLGLGLLERIDGTTCLKTKYYEEIPVLKRWDADKFVVSLIQISENHVLDRVSRSIARFRDLLVLSLMDPDAFEVIGVLEDGKPSFPGLPVSLSERYLGIMRSLNIPVSMGIVIIWRRYRRYYSEAAVLDALCRLLESKI